MKKILLIGVLVLAIIASIVTGTLAVYNASLDEISGDVVAKEFVFDSVGIENFNKELKIAPTEKVTFKFNATNTKNGVTSEVPLDVSLAVSVGASANKSAIANLKVNILDDDGNLVEEIALNNGVGGFVIEKEMGITPETRIYVIEVEWVEDLVSSDNDYQGSGFGSKITVKASATQHVGGEIEQPIDTDVEFEMPTAERSREEALSYVSAVIAKMCNSKYIGAFIDGNGNVNEGNYSSNGKQYSDTYQDGTATRQFFVDNIKLYGKDRVSCSVSKSDKGLTILMEYYGDGFFYYVVCEDGDGVVDNYWLGNM